MQYFDEFDERMEREEVTRIENVVNTQCFCLQESAGGSQGIACLSQMCLPARAVTFFKYVM